MSLILNHTVLHHIGDEFRRCYQDGKWTDVTLVSCKDGHKVSVHGLILAAACPLFRSILNELLVGETLENIIILIPDSDKNDIEMFIKCLYGLSPEMNLESSVLWKLIHFHNTDSSYIKEAVKAEETVYYNMGDYNDNSDVADTSNNVEKETNLNELNLSDVKQILSEEPHRIRQLEVHGRQTKIWSCFLQLEINKIQVPFLICKQCNEVFHHTKTSSTTQIKKHYLEHLERQQGRSDDDRLPYKTEESSFEINDEDESTKKSSKVHPESIIDHWDPNIIRDIKNELQAPSQKVKSPVSEQPGVSKFAIGQLIQSEDSRVTFEESMTHSAVWEKFVKIVLDTVEVPFVCCKMCRKVYTHDRTLGTSSLLRHVCTVPGTEVTKTGGGLPRILVQELVNTKSSRVKVRQLDLKYNIRLEDMVDVFSRVVVDSKDTEYVSCRYCSILYLFSASKANLTQVKKLELHDCFIKNAPCMSFSCPDPRDERELSIVFVREHRRIAIKEKVRNEPNLHYFLLDGKKSDFVHCTKCLKFFPISCLNLTEERIHRCHKVKTAEHNIQFKQKKPHQCDKCQAAFKSEHFLEIHLRREHGEGSATVMCSHCAKEFPTERLAKKHELHIHYPELSKKFACKDCDATFHDRSKLKLHAMKHSSIKPYVCEQCGKGFNWVASFQDHMDMHQGVKKYTCEFCTRQFTKRNTLNNHRRLHTGEKPFMCPSPGCGMTFVQRTACKTHAKKRHNIEITMYTRNPEVPQTAASLAQMSLAQRSEMAVLQERIVEGVVVELEAGQLSQVMNDQRVVHILQPVSQSEETTQIIRLVPQLEMIRGQVGSQQEIIRGQVVSQEFLKGDVGD